MKGADEEVASLDLVHVVFMNIGLENVALHARVR